MGQGQGAGDVITPLGRDALDDPSFLDQLRSGKLRTTLPVAEASPPTPPTRFDVGEAARRAFFTPGQLRVVPMLILVNLLAFAGAFAVAVRSGVPATQFLAGGDPIALHAVGAVSAGDLAKGEWWRLIASSFLHYGMVHLALNMLALWVVRRAETLWGSARFLVLYLICGVCGSAAGVFYNPGDPTTTYYLAGASGALWGVMASMGVWLLLNRSHLPPDQVRLWTQQLLFILVINVGVSLLPGISAAAHLGGGVAGAIGGYLLQLHRHGTPTRRAIAGMQLALLPTLFLLGLGLALEYDPRLQQFMVIEYRQQIDERLGKLVPGMDAVEPKADQLFVQEPTKRDPAQIGELRDVLRRLVKDAKEGGEWVQRSSAVGPAKALREKGLALTEALVPYAEAMDRQVGGEVVAEMNDLRKAWQEARLVWAQAMTK